MRKLRMMLVALAAVLFLSVAPALADQLSLGGDGTFYFCSTGAAGSPIVLSTTPGCSPAGGTAGASSGFFEHPIGVPDLAVGFQPWQMVFPSTNPFEFGSLVGGVFSVVSPQNVTTFSWGGSGIGTITGDITWTTVKDGTDRPQFLGNLVITGNGNTGLLQTDFPVGSAVRIDFTVSLGSNPQLEEVFNNPCLVDTPPSGCATTTEGTFSTGEVPAVPEPGAVLLLGVGFVGVGAFLRRRGRGAQVG